MPRNMTQRSAQRIGKALGPNHDFARRASMTVRNESQEDDKKEEEEGSSSDKQNVTEEKQGDDKQTQPTSD
ncbi:hypothetical protein F5B18DRAFT_221651 [Nemania serpens]|nr:hypothetical protein F5B18DRAFT_221651 [Nemania serpens]